jgi:hypothetical protein
VKFLKRSVKVIPFFLWGDVNTCLGQTKVKWENPKTVMVITKPGDLSLIGITRDLALWFMTTSKACQGVKV